MGLLKDVAPDIVFLQETHLPYNFTNFICPKEYTGCFHNLPQNTVAKQGIGVLIKRNIPHMYQNKNSNILCSVLQLSFEQAINIVNAYIPPNQSFTSPDIIKILENLNGSTILLGDLNSWSPLWGSLRTNTRGKNIERAIRENNLIVLNDGSPTHLSTHNTFTHIDI